MSTETSTPGAGGGAPPVRDERPGGGAVTTTPDHGRTEQGRVRPMSQIRPMDGAEYLRRLRAEFPHIGFVADIRGGVWMAVQGKHLLIRADSGVELRDRLLAAPGPH